MSAKASMAGRVGPTVTSAVSLGWGAVSAAAESSRGAPSCDAPSSGLGVSVTSPRSLRVESARSPRRSACAPRNQGHTLVHYSD